MEIKISVLAENSNNFIRILYNKRIEDPIKITELIFQREPELCNNIFNMVTLQDIPLSDNNYYMVMLKKAYRYIGFELLGQETSLYEIKEVINSIIDYNGLESVKNDFFDIIYKIVKNYMNYDEKEVSIFGHIARQSIFRFSHYIRREYRLLLKHNRHIFCDMDKSVSEEQSLIDESYILLENNTQINPALKYMLMMIYLYKYNHRELENATGKASEYIFQLMNKLYSRDKTYKDLINVSGEA